MDNFFKDTPDFKFHLEHPLVKKIVELKEEGFKDSETFDFAPLNHDDAVDSYERVLDIVGDICMDTIAPNAEAVDVEGPKIVNNEVVYAHGTTVNYAALHEAGLVGWPCQGNTGG